MKSILFLALAFISFGLVVSSSAEDSDTFSPYVSSDGSITLPTEFRDTWTYLGSWVHAEDLKSGFHNVYTEPGVAEDYRTSGKFPDGAVLVKEVLAEGKQDMTTGKGVVHAKNDIVLWFVMVKDEKGRFKDNPKWGDGWGWAQFMADDPSKDISTDYKKDCLGCHVPAKDTDWVYTYGYPVLSGK